MSKRLKTLPKLEKELWKWFSLAVRLRDVQPNGLCKCITCNSQIPYYGSSICHAGHFRSRNEKPVKYDWTNVHAQCASCNTFRNGEQYLYGVEIDKRYGEGHAEKLSILGKQTMKITRDYIEDKKQECLKIIMENAKSKNLWDWKKGFTKTELSELNGM